MEIFLIVLGVIFILVGIIGCFVPALPGPPLAYISLLLLQVGPEVPFSTKFMIIVALIVAAIFIVDYMIPAIGAKKYGGSKFGIIGAFVGVIMGLFIFPPFGFVIFPLLGALVGEILNGANTGQAFKAAFGTFIGLIFGTILKFSTTIMIAYFFFTNL